MNAEKFLLEASKDLLGFLVIPVGTVILIWLICKLFTQPNSRRH